MVLRSRSRTTAAPARMMASIVMLLRIAITLVNQAVVRFGLNAIRTSRFTVDGFTPYAWEIKSAISVVTICCA